MLIPLSLLEDVQGPKSEPVFLTRPRQGVLAASWDDKGVCREMEYDELEAGLDAPAFPDLPAQFSENPPELLTAFATPTRPPTLAAFGTLSTAFNSGRMA
jgi:hypothetical protein